MTDKKQDPGFIPLRERKDEIIPLAKAAIQAAHQHMATDMKNLAKEAEEFLLAHEWPGNEQELETAVKRACILSEGQQLEIEDFDLKHRQARSVGKFIESRLRGFMRNIKRFESFNLYDMVIPEVEKALIIMVLKETGGNQIKASMLLGINRNTLRSKIRKLGIKVKTK